MKSIERRFKSIEENNPLWGKYVCLAEAVKGKNFTKRTIREWFELLVPESDYELDKKKTLILELVALSKKA